MLIGTDVTCLSSLEFTGDKLATICYPYSNQCELETLNYELCWVATFHLKNNRKKWVKLVWIHVKLLGMELNYKGIQFQRVVEHAECEHWYKQVME